MSLLLLLQPPPAAPDTSVTIAGTATLYENATGTSVIIPVPAGATVGEYLVAHVTHSSTGATPPVIAAPTGWTKIDQADGQGSGSQGTAVFYRPVVASEPASYTFPTNTTAGRVTGIMVRLAGVDSTTQLDTASVEATTIAQTAAVTVPSLTTVTPGAMVLYGASINAATAGDLVAPAEATLLTKATGTGRRAGLYYEARPTAGATGTRTFSHTSATAVQWAVIAVAFRPAADRYIDWEGHNWWVRSGGPSNPGMNRWGTGTENVQVQPNGDLTLTVAQVGGVWKSAEIDLNEPGLGYGRYRWTYDVDAVGMDPQVVLGLYVYDKDVSAAPSQREIDIEVTRWGTAGEPSQFWYSLQPVSDGKHRQHDHPATVGPYTSEFIWQAGQVYWRTTDGNGLLIGEHVVTEGVQTPGNARPSLNLWLNSGTAGPDNGQPISATITSFDFTAAVTHTLVKADQFAEDFASAEGWALYNGASITGGELVAPCVPGYALGYTGSILDIRESSTQIETTSQPLGAGNFSQEAIWTLRHDDNNLITMFASGGGVAGRLRQNGVNSAQTTSVTQNTTAQKFWRISHTGTTVTFQTSPNGSTWTSLGSLTTTLTSQQLSTMRMRIESGYWSTETTPAPFKVTQVGASAAQQLTASLTDAAAIVDSASTVLDAVRQLTDTVGTSESISTRLDAVRSLTDAAAIVDSATTQLAAARTLTDAAGITDSASTVLDAARQLTDAAAIVDSATTALDAARQLTDAAGISESISTQLAAARELTDAAAIVDSATWALTQVVERTLSDSAAISESISTQLAAVRELADAAGISESITTRLDAVRTMTDSAAIVDSASTVLDAQRGLTDAAAIVDSATTSLTTARDLTDAAAITDSVTWRLDVVRQLTDSVAITDSVSTVMDARRELVDNAAITDQASASLATEGGRQLADSAAITDSATWRLDVVRELTDSAGITDEATTALSTPRQLTDSAAITDSATWRIDRYVTLVDSAAITDSVTAEITTGAEQNTRSLTDSAGITDSATWRIDRVVTLVDSAAITDSASTDLRVGGAQLVDHAAITDSATWRIDRHVTLVDSVAITDSATTARQIFVTLVDSAGIVDSATAVITTGRNIAVQWGTPQARQLSGEASGRQTTARTTGYRTLRGTRVFRAGHISRESDGGS